MRKLLAMTGVCLLAGTAFAEAPRTLVDLLIKHWQTSKEFTLAVAGKMPEDQYSFKASPAEMGFGEMANQIADANMIYCSTAFGAKPPGETKEFAKSAVAKHLADSFDFCIAGLRKMSDTALMKTTGTGSHQSTAFERVWAAFTHTAHHRGQLEVYLRLKGIQPPDYQF